MIYVVCTNDVKGENAEEFIKIANEHAALSKELDDGCVRFDVTNFIPDENKVIFFEIWKGKEFLDKHAERCKNLPILTKMNSLRYGKDLKIYEIN